MKKYLFQRFLTECNTDGIDITDFYTKSNDGVKIFVSKLDETIDTKDDLIMLLNKYDKKENIILINDRPNTPNKIIMAYSDKTLKSYVYWIKLLGYKCLIQQKDIC